jgi:hypothetical protein
MKKYLWIGLAAVIGIVAISAFVSASGSVFFKLSNNDTIYKAYQTAAEFFSDGGASDFSNVQVIDNSPSIGSVSTASEYHSLTTFATTTGAYLIKTGSGTFGSVIVSVLGAGNVVFYDATTTIPANRTVQATSSLPVVGVIGASQAAGTYTYDTVFFSGLIAVYNGAQGTSTVTFR